MLVSIAWMPGAASNVSTTGPVYRRRARSIVSVGAATVRPEGRWCMVTVNVVVLAGRLSANPELAEMPSGDTVARLRLQVPEAGKRVLPLPVAVWDRAPRKGCERLAKGDAVMVRGHLVRRFMRGQGGGRALMEVVASEVKKLPDEETE